jgi:hypothetical protein
MLPVIWVHYTAETIYFGLDALAVQYNFPFSLDDAT